MFAKQLRRGGGRGLLIGIPEVPRSPLPSTLRARASLSRIFCRRARRASAPLGFCSLPASASSSEISTWVLGHATPSAHPRSQTSIQEPKPGVLRVCHFRHQHLGARSMTEELLSPLHPNPTPVFP